MAFLLSAKLVVMRLVSRFDLSGSDPTVSAGLIAVLLAANALPYSSRIRRAA